MDFIFARDVTCYVSTLSFLMETSSQRWKQNSKRGTIDLGVVVRRSRFETTALEMPAGFGLFTIAPILHAMGGRARTYGQAM